MSTPEEERAVLSEAAAILAELFTPEGVLIHWSAPNWHLGGKRPCDLWQDRDLEGLRKLCAFLNATAQGAFS